MRRLTKEDRLILSEARRIKRRRLNEMTDGEYLAREIQGVIDNPDEFDTIRAVFKGAPGVETKNLSLTREDVRAILAVLKKRYG